MTRKDIKTITDIVHKTIYGFFDVCGDDEETPITDKDKLLLKINKAICTNIKALEQEPCGDVATFKEDVLDVISRIGLQKSGTKEVQAVAECLRAVEALPPVNPQEPKTGHWSRKTKVDAYDIAGVKTWGIKCQCDRCDFTTIVVEDFGYYKYCPNCGCRMVEPQESEDKE